MSSTPDATEYEFDIAVSFAGENRKYVEDVVRAVQGSGDLKVFYDQDYRYDLWGEDGVEFFTRVFNERARFVVMFISHHYAEKEWPRLEKRSALSRALTQRTAYVLPVRLDDTKLEGLLPTVQYLDAVREGISGIVAGISHKLTGSNNVNISNTKTYHGRVAQTAEEMQDLITQKTPGWEYVLYASVLKLKRDELSDARRDHRIAYATSNNKRVASPDSALDFARTGMADIGSLADLLTKVLNPEAFREALGNRGEPGDPDRIIHIATRFIDCYEHLLKVASNLRGATVDFEFKNLVELTARITDQPLREIDDFIDEFLELMDGVCEQLTAGESVDLQLVVKISLDDNLISEFARERERIEGLRIAWHLS
jgi:hypothetical protein